MADLESFTLQERLRRHSKAFEQLLNLIPAKHYFSANDNSTQWNKRKQTKEESQRAKKAKLDPDSVMSAADFGRKRQGEEIACASEGEEQEGDVERGGAEEPMSKQQKKQRKKELAKEPKTAARGEGEGGGKDVKSKSKLTDQSGEVGDDGEAEEIQFNGFNFSTQLSHYPSPLPQPSTSQKLKYTMEISPEKRLEQKARLEARIQQLRAKRNADSPDGTPARNRNELMAARRREEAQTRKEKKKEIRLKQKATVEQTKNVTLAPILVEDGQPGGGKSLENAQRDFSIKPPVGNRDKEKKKLAKKVSLKKGRPGFEGSLKAGKKERK